MVTGTEAAGEDRLLTLPNAFTAIRLLCIPLFVWLLFGRHPHDRLHAALLLAALGATDWVDGYLARHLHQVSTLGKVLDPTADRLLLGVAVAAILIDGSAPLWIGLVVLGREAIVAAAALALVVAGASRIDVQWVGKAGTLGLMVTFPLFLAGHSTASWAPLAEALAWCAAVPSLALSLYAAVTYVPIAREALLDGRRAIPPHPAGGRRAPPPRRGRGESRHPGGRGGYPAPAVDLDHPQAHGAPRQPAADGAHRGIAETHGIEEIVVTVAFQANAIRTYFGNGAEFGVRMVYATEDMPLGTAGSVGNARAQLDDPFLVIVRRCPHRHRPRRGRATSTATMRPGPPSR